MIDGERQVSTVTGPGNGDQFSGFVQKSREQARQAVREAGRKLEVLTGLWSVFETKLASLHDTGFKRRQRRRCFQTWI
jgi:hypothetical protein